MAAEMADTNPTLRAELQKVLKGIQDRLEQALSKMRARKELLPSSNPRTLAQFAVAAIQGGLLLTKTHKDISPLKEVLDHTLRYLKSHARGA